MRIAFAIVAGLGLCLTTGCHPNPEPQQREVPAALEQYVRNELPPDLEDKTLVDFEGKVHLLGYQLQAKEPVSARDQLDLTLYWKSVAPLGPGWSLLTHLVDASGRRIKPDRDGGSFDDVGPLRERAKPLDPQALGPSAWTPGKIYVDSQQLKLPARIESEQLTVLVGIGQSFAEGYATGDAGAADAGPETPDETTDAGPPPEPPAMRLRILSGRSDECNRAVVATLQTTWRPRRAHAQRPKAERRRQAKPLRRRPGSPRAPLRARPGPGHPPRP